MFPWLNLFWPYHYISMSTEFLSYIKPFESLSSQVQDVEFAQVQIQVADGLKQGNEALKKMHEVYIKQVHTCVKSHINKVVQ